jgi:hypothetical protein
MKKLLFALSLTAVLVACKKDKKNEFTATDVTGTTVVIRRIHFLYPYSCTRC